MSANILRVTDAEDPRLAPYHAIRERDLVGREGRFVAEGKVVLRVLFSARRFEAESALILESRLEGAADVLSLAPPDMPVYVAPQAVMDAVAGFHVHRGILAIGRRSGEQDAASLVASLGRRATVVVLVGISNHDNVGSIFRSAAAFGADAVLLDATSCDPLYRKSIRVSVGAALKVPFARFVGIDRLADQLSQNGYRQFALTPRGALDIADIGTLPDRCALYLGSEGDGLPEALIQRLEATRIDIAEDFDSLNVATAAAVALHRLRRS
jgi:tRNA G18 (ribose-2'-O)-methylase SpoU